MQSSLPTEIQAHLLNIGDKPLQDQDVEVIFMAMRLLSSDPLTEPSSPRGRLTDATVFLKMWARWLANPVPPANRFIY